MTARERFHAIMNFQPFDRLPIVEWASWWDKTLQRWHSEGMPIQPDGAKRYEIYRHHGMDVYKQNWVAPRSRGCPQPASHGAPIISSMEDYERLKQHLFPWPCLDEKMWRAWADEQKQLGHVLWFTLDGFFWFPRTLLGIEQHLYAFYDQPGLMHRMNTDLSEWMLKVIDGICSFCTPDFMTFGEDMSYNHGPMLSKELFDEFMTPYYARVVPRLKERGIRVIVDSDGDITVPCAWFEDAGVEGILPLERQSGVDINRLRAEHPKMLFIGHYDKMVMNKGEAAIRAEFERLLPAAGRGGFIPSVDHQTPPGVSYKEYLLYLELFREYAAKAGALSQSKG
ncbi:MAG: hypothetical protein C0404_04855 [Verrucomicrobia bacterium]|nr:hypothetical protein [Verrucomicrobiota bacterium]